jgi:protein-S-isoprenylcysteine O-methyltransferase Ste14
MKKRIKNQGITIFLAVLITLLFSKSLFPHQREGFLDIFLDALGIIIILFGFLLRIVSRGYKEEKSANGTILVKDGPYALVRNPMYLGTLMIGTGMILVLFELWIFILFIIVFMRIYIPQIKEEEALLSKRFGDEYYNYYRLTPRSFPKSFFFLNMHKYLPLKLSWVRKEIPSLLAVCFAVVLFESWEEFTSLGSGEFLKELWEIFFIVIVFLGLIITMNLVTERFNSR